MNDRGQGAQADLAHHGQGNRADYFPGVPGHDGGPENFIAAPLEVDPAPSANLLQYNHRLGNINCGESRLNGTETGMSEDDAEIRTKLTYGSTSAHRLPDQGFSD